MLFKYIVCLFITLLISVSFVNPSFGQVTWKSFEDRDRLFSIQIPSNWYPEEMLGAEKLAPIDYIFRYADKGDSFAWLELMISNSTFKDSREAAESYISGYRQFDDFKLLKPINCNTYTLNNESACSFLSNQQLEGEKPRNVLDIVSISSQGIQTDVIFITSSNIYDAFLPVGEYSINSIQIDSNKIGEALAIQSASELESVMPSIPPSTDVTNGTYLSNTLVYENSDLGFSLQYPSEWSKAESFSPPSVSFQSPRTSITDQAPESIAITTELITSGISLESYSDSALNLLREQFPSIGLIEITNSTLSGYPAKQVIYTYSMDGIELQNLQIWTLVDNMVYAVTYGGIVDEFDDSLDIVNNLIKSFQITKIS